MDMLHHELLISKWVNALLGGPVGAFVSWLGFHVDPDHPVIPDHVVMCLLVATALTLGAFWLRRRIRVEDPGKLQLALEAVVGGLLSMLEEYVGHKGRQFLALVGTLGLFILLGNLLGLVPGFMSPTSNLNVTVGCAVVSFLYYNFQGIRAQGLIRYLKHFVGPIPLMAPIMIPIEAISHFSRILSLSFRLFGNIFGEELVILILASLIPFLIPLPMMFFAIFTGVLQAFVFVMLTVIYLQGAVAAEEH
jgi:F-type H+-transporting ATPase subunit a